MTYIFLYTGNYSDMKHINSPTYEDIKATKLFGLTLRLFKDSVSTTEVSYSLGKNILLNVAFVKKIGGK
jgi:hypothetical protein